MIKKSDEAIKKMIDWSKARTTLFFVSIAMISYCITKLIIFISMGGYNV